MRWKERRRRRCGASCARRVSFSLAIVALVWYLLAPLACGSGGIVLEAGDIAPFGGVLISERDLAGILAEKNRQREELQIRCEAELEDMRMRLHTARHEAELLRQAVVGRDKALAAVRAQFESVRHRLSRWRFGIGLLVLKSPEHIE